MSINRYVVGEGKLKAPPRHEKQKGRGWSPCPFLCSLTIGYSSIHEGCFLSTLQGSSFFLLRLDEGEDVHDVLLRDDPRCLVARYAPCRQGQRTFSINEDKTRGAFRKTPPFSCLPSIEWPR